MKYKKIFLSAMGIIAGVSISVPAAPVFAENEKEPVSVIENQQEVVSEDLEAEESTQPKYSDEKDDEGEEVSTTETEESKEDLNAEEDNTESVQLKTFATKTNKSTKKGWIKNKDGSWNYYGTNGKAYTGWHWMTSKEGEKTDHWSYFGTDGKLYTGWVRLGKGTSNPDGNNAAHWSYFGDNGWLRTGWQQMGVGTSNPDKNNAKHWSYFGDNGWLRTGWQQMGVGTSNPDKNNAKHWSYFGDNGWLRTGWLQLGVGTSEPDNGNAKHWSYFGDNGWLRIGKQTIEKRSYTFDSKGWLTSSKNLIPDGCYVISPSKSSSYALDVSGASVANGASIQSYKKNGTIAQMFRIRAVGDEIYTVETATTIYKASFDITGGKIKSSATIQQYTYSGKATQKWKIIKNSDGTYTFKTSDGKYVLDIEDGKLAGGKAVLAKASKNSTTQKFKLSKTSGYLLRNSRKYYFNSNGDTPQIGIDVSKWNGDIDWAKVKADGIGFAIIRTSYGSNEVYEKLTVQNIKGCEKNGIPYGVYFYSIATTNAEADKEVALVKKILGNYKPKLGVYIDIEDTNIYKNAFGDIYSASSRRKITDLTKRMANSLKSSGYKVGVYANADYLNNVLYKKELPDILWGAYYYKNATSNTSGLSAQNSDWNLWQYTDQGKVDGISGSVDMNTMIKKYW